MKKWQLLAPVGIAAAAAVLLAKKKPAGKAEPKAKGAAAKKPEMKNPKDGVYSFLSGYADPRTVEVTVKYDADKVDFSVIEDEFLAYSSDSHVAVAYSGAFTVQLEYAGLYSGEDFAAMIENLKIKYGKVTEVAYGENKGAYYLTGDSACICFPVDEFSYLLVTAVKGPDNDDELADLPANASLAFFFENMSISVK